MKLATWNVNSLTVRLPRLLDWLAANQPDVIGLQETKLDDARFPAMEIAAAGYEAIFYGQRTYNGVAILSQRAPPSVAGHAGVSRRSQARAGGDGRRHPLRLLLRAQRAVGRFRQVPVQAALARGAPRPTFAKSSRGIRGSPWSATSTSRPKTATCTIRTSGEVRCCAPTPSAPRSATGSRWASRMRSGCSSSPRRRSAGGTIAMLAFPKNHGLRIDHILLSPALAATCTSCRIDRQARKGEKPSDHAPVIAELDRH